MVACGTLPFHFGRLHATLPVWKTPIPFTPVTSPEESPLEDLARLSRSDLKTQPTERLLTGVRDAEVAIRSGREWSGQFIAELRSRDIPWSELVKLTGIPQTTLWHRAQKYL